MDKRASGKKDTRRALWAFLALVAAAVALQAMPLLFLSFEGDVSAALYVIHLYAVVPLCALVLSALAAKRGVHPLAAFFPVGLGLLFSPLYRADGVALLCLALSLVGAVGGAEIKKRAEKRRNHGK